MNIRLLSERDGHKVGAILAVEDAYGLDLIKAEIAEASAAPVVEPVAESATTTADAAPAVIEEPTVADVPVVETVQAEPAEAANAETPVVGHDAKVE